ncbi:M15 family metallopeptidase [Glaciibacter psychrotolerans]
MVAASVTVLAVASLAAGVLTGAASRGEPSAAAIPTPAPTPTETVRPSPTQSAPPVAVPTFDRGALSIDDPASIWVVVNKLRPLNPADFTPPDLVDVPVPHTWAPRLRLAASDAVVALFAAAETEAGLTLASNSAYRSYDSQVSVYDDDVASNGQAYADTSTARPGTSEHQTGLAIDIGADSGRCSLNVCFADTAEGQWLAANAWRFGFLLRYPADKEAVTGYAFEPWHYRYVGVELSTEMHSTGVTTLEEFFGLPAAPTYG